MRWLFNQGNLLNQKWDISKFFITLSKRINIGIKDINKSVTLYQGKLARIVYEQL